MQEAAPASHGREILVTGVAGFIGSRAALRLASRGWRVRGLDRVSPPRPVADVLCRLIVGDLRVEGVAEEALAGVDTVLHAAAHTDLPRAQADPEVDFGDNVLGAFRLLEAARKSRTPPTIAFLSSFRVYGDNVDLALAGQGPKGYTLALPFQWGISELFSTDQCERTAHGTHKLLADLMAQEFAHSYGLRVGVFRVGPVAGPGHDASSDGCWLAALQRASADRLLQIDPDQTLDLLHVDDLVDAVLAFVDSDWHHLVLNVGGGVQNAVRPYDVAAAILTTGAQGDGRVDPAGVLATYPKVWVTDIGRAARALGWTPRRDLKTILEEQGIPWQVAPSVTRDSARPAENICLGLA